MFQKNNPGIIRGLIVEGKDQYGRSYTSPNSTAYARVTMTTEGVSPAPSSFALFLPVMLEGHAWASIEGE